MKTALIIYSTTDGHTKTISERIGAKLSTDGYDVSTKSLAEVKNNELQEANKVILGASIRYGYHNKKVAEFIVKNIELLRVKKSAFFSVNAVARKPEKNTPQTNPYTKKFLSSIEWKPDVAAVFAGKIDYKKYNLLDRLMIQFIMYITKGPTNKNACVEFTDWKQVAKFSHSISHL